MSASKGSALADLERQGFSVIDLVEGQPVEHTPWYRRQLFQSGTIPASPLSETAHLLASLLGSSLPLPEALEIASEAASNKPLAESLIRVRVGLEAGMTPARAFAAVSDLPPDFLAFVGGGDRANTLSISLHEAGDYFALKSATRGRVIGALAYPLFLLLVALAVVSLIVFFLTPTLYDTLAATGKDVGGMIATLEQLRQGITQSPLLSLGIGLSGLVLLVLGIRLCWHMLLRASPWLAQQRHAADYARISRIVAALLRSGRPLSEALHEAEQLSQGDLKNQLQLAQLHLSEGAASATAFEASKNTPALFQRLYGFGEHANQLEDALALAAKVLEEQHKGFVTRATNLITPLATLLVGLIIGLLVFVMISAVLEVSDIAL